jgi:phage terminase large subunit
MTTMTNLTPEKKAKLRETLEDPVKFVRRWLDADTWGTQNSILRSISSPHSKTVVKACHSSGKTFIAAAAVLWFLARFKEAIVVTTAPTAKQVEKMLWGDIQALLERSKYPFPKANLTEIKFGPKRYAIGFTTSVTKQDEGVKFQGFHADHILVVLDEAPGIDPKIWEAIEGARAGGDVRILALGNPTIVSGPFHEAFHSGRESWNLFTISAFDTPNFDGISLTYTGDDGKPVKLGSGDRDLLALPDEELDKNCRSYLTTRRWVKDKFAEWGPCHPLWDARVCGAFPAQSEDSLLSLTWLERAKAREGGGTGRITAGLDVAGPGEDETVLTLRRGIEVLSIDAWPEADPRGKVVARLNEVRDELAAVNVDSIGIGWGIYLHLVDLGFPAMAINVGEAAQDTEKFANRKAELYWGLRLRLQPGDMSGIVDEKAIGQLAGIRYKHNPRGQIVIESKDDARKRGVRSPDRAESVMLAFVADTDMDVWAKLGGG